MRVTFLNDLAFFLNKVTPDMTAGKWEIFCRVAKKRKLFISPFRFPPFTDQVTISEAQALRQEIARHLSYRDKNPGVWFASLLVTLNSLELKTAYECRPVRLYGQPRPGQVVLKVGKNKVRYVPRIYPKAITVRELMYVTLGAALMDGTLERLKKCSQCGKWSVKKAGWKFCSSECKDAFHYGNRIKTGYFKDYQQGKRVTEKAAEQKARGRLVTG